MFLQLQTFIVPNWHWSSNPVGYARVFCSEPFFEKETGLYVPQGQVTNIASACAVYDCTISNSNFTLPQVLLASTTDSTVMNALYTVVLYDNKNVPRYTLLENAFVDPVFFMEPLTSSVIVTTAFTNAANGTYTWRGIQAGKAYYNLETFDDSITASALVWNPGNSHWEILAADGSVYYYTEATSNFPFEATTWLADTGLLPVPEVLQDVVTTASTWEMLILSNQGRPVNSWQNYLPVWDVSQTKSFALRYQQPLGYSSSLQPGKIYIDPDPDLSTHPIAVGINNARWAGRKYLSDYGCDIAAAIVALGSEVCELVVTCACTVSADATTPVTMLITMEGNGKFTVLTGKTLTINSFTYAAAKQYFFGLGTVLLGRNACGPVIAGEWWCGKSGDIADCTHAMTQACLSATNQGTRVGGATLAFGAGKWSFTEISLPKMVILEGAGMDPDAGSYSPFTFAGTVFKLYDETASFLLQIPGGSRNLGISNCALTTGNAAAARCIYQPVTEYSDGIFLNNVSVQSTRVGPSRPADDLPRADWLVTPLIEFHATAFQESIRQDFTGVWFQIPENGVGIYCDTANTTLAFNNCKGQAGKQATIQRMRNCGPIEENDNCDWEGTGDYTNLAYVYQRTIAFASVARIPGQADPGIGQPFSRITLDPSTPSDHQFTVNDIMRSCRFSGFDAYITKIEDAFNAVLSFYPASPITSQSCTINTFTEFPNTAYAVRVYNGNVVSGTFNSSVDEGFNYSCIVGCATFNQFQFNNCFNQGRMKIIETCKVDYNSGHLPSGAFEDALTTQALEVNINGTVFSNTGFAGQLFTIQPQVWRIQRTAGNISYSYTPTVTGIFPTYDMFTDTYTFVSPQVNSAQREIFSDYGTLYTDPALGLYTKEIHGDVNIQKALLRIGHKDFLTDTWQYWYDDLRNEQTGRKQTTGNQTGQGSLVGWDFNGDIYVSNFRGGCIYPTQISVDSPDYAGGVGPTAAGLYDVRTICISAATDYLKLSGVILDYLDSDSVGYPDGTELIVKNVGTKIIALPNEDTGSGAIARLKTCTGQQLYLMPGCDATLKYTKGAANSILRWYTSLNGTPKSPVVEGAMRFNTTVALGTTGAVTLNAGLSNRFSMAITGNVTLSITNVGVGSFLTLTVLTTTTNAYTITFSSPFKTVGGTLITSAFNTVTQKMFFMEESGFMEETSRSGVMS